MRGLIFFGAAILSSCVAQPADAAPMTYGCDTPADRFSAIMADVGFTSFTIKGAVKPNEFRKGKYLPLAQILLDTADEQNSLAFKLVAMGARAKDATAILETRSKGKDAKPVALAIVKLGETLPFSIRIVNGSTADYRIGAAQGQIALSLPEKGVLNVICSTGDFEFTGLEWSAG